MEKMQKELDELKKNPEKVRAMIALLESLLDEKNEKITSLELDDRQINKMVVYHLHNLSIPVDYKGYKFIREGLVMAFKNPTIIERITKDFYPTLAKKYKTTTKNVEHMIRYVIEVSWNQADPETLKAYFENYQERPSNRVFLARLLEILQIYGEMKP